MTTKGEEFIADVEAAFGAHPTLKAQAYFLKTYGQEAADADSKACGTKLGSLRPGVLPEKYGGPDNKLAHSENPWTYDNEKSLERRVSIIKSLGTEAACRYAKAAGKTLAGADLK
jgi:hypothetical protein